MGVNKFIYQDPFIEIFVVLVAKELTRRRISPEKNATNAEGGRRKRGLSVVSRPTGEENSAATGDYMVAAPATVQMPFSEVYSETQTTLKSK